MNEKVDASSESAGPPHDAAALAERHKALLENKKAVTSQTSETCRYICFGLLATFYALITAKGDSDPAILARDSRALSIMALVAALSLTSDYFQYLAGRVAVDRALKEEDQLFDTRWLSMRLREFFYWSKQILMLAAVTIFLIVLSRYLLGTITPL